jgi:hypothetical protein
MMDIVQKLSSSDVMQLIFTSEMLTYIRVTKYACYIL